MNTFDLRMTRNLTKLKQRLTDILIHSSSSMKALSIHCNVGYPGHLSGSKFSLVENCRPLCLMV